MGLELRHEGRVLATVDARVEPDVPGPIAGEGYHLVWRDEFEGDQLDRSVWQPEPWYGEQSIDWTNRVKVENSILTLTGDSQAVAPKRAGTTIASIGPRTDTYPRHPQAKAWQEGYFEARARCTDTPWTKLAIWFMSLYHPNTWPGPRDPEVFNSEWDWVENGQRNWEGPIGYADNCHFTALHSNTTAFNGIADKLTTKFSRRTSPVGFCDWHVWGGKWTADYVSTYCDGQLLTTTPIYPESTPQPMYLLLTGGWSSSTAPGNPPKPQFVETQIDYVRVWQK